MTQKREIIVQAHHLISLKAYEKSEHLNVHPLKLTLGMPYNLIIRTRFIQ